MIRDLLVFKTSQTQKDWTLVGAPLELSWTSAPLAVTTVLGRSGEVSFFSHFFTSSVSRKTLPVASEIENPGRLCGARERGPGCLAGWGWCMGSFPESMC